MTIVHSAASPKLLSDWRAGRRWCLLAKWLPQNTYVYDIRLPNGRIFHNSRKGVRKTEGNVHKERGDAVRMVTRLG